MSEKIHLFAPSKINLYLKITGETDEGFHTMDTVMQTTTLGDEIVISLLPSNDFTIDLSSTEKKLPLHENNICYKVAKAFQVHTEVSGNIKIHIIKRVPSRAGLGGGSGDGAAVLVGLNVLFDTNLSLDTLCEIAAPVGKDIPFCIVGGTGRGTHFGEQIIPLSSLPQCSIVICKPQGGVSTPEAFRRFDDFKGEREKTFSSKPLLKGIAERNLIQIGSGMCNDFEKIVGNKDTEFILSIYKKHGSLGQVLSGSGSSVVALFDKEEAAQFATKELKQDYSFVYLGKPYPKGPTIIKRTS